MIGGIHQSKLGRVIAVAALVLALSSAGEAARKEEKKKAERDPFAASTGGVFLFSKEQEIQLGKDVREQVIKQYKLYEDSELVSYVRRVASRLAAHADRQNIVYDFFVLDDPLVNAFALPGGTIYITRGILTIFDNEAQMAAVLGHEIGHVVERHSMKHMQGATAIDLAWKVFGKGGNMPFGYQLGLDLLLFKPYGRGDELRSDALGVKYSYLAGYKADEAAHVFEQFQKRETFRVPAFLRSHPVDAERIKRVRQLWEVIQTRPDLPAGDTPLKTNADDYARIVFPHTYRVLYPEVRTAFEEFHAAVSRKDLDAVMRGVDKGFKSRWLKYDRDGLRTHYEKLFADVEQIVSQVTVREFRFLDKDAISVLCEVTETRTAAGRSDKQSVTQVALFEKRPDKEKDGPLWRLAALEDANRW